MYTIALLSIANSLGNLWTSRPSLPMAIILFFVYQLAFNAGYRVDFTFAIVLQLLTYFIHSHPKLSVPKISSNKTLLCFVPVTEIITPVETTFFTNLALGGSLILFLTLYEIYQRKEFVIVFTKELYNKFAPSIDFSYYVSRISLPSRPHSFEGQYSIGAKLGEGAFSTVHEANCKRSKDSYAVKIIKKSKLLEEEETRLYQEIEVMKELKECEEILSLRSVFEDSQNFFLVADKMKGGDLLERLADVSSFSEQQARQLMKSIHKAVGYMHSKGVAHRDIKLENILLSSNDRGNLDVKLSDFGFAKKKLPHRILLPPCADRLRT